MSRVTSRCTLAALACLTLFLFPAEARACSCVEYGTPPCAAYWRADAVFAGVVTDIQPLPGTPGSPPTALLRFRVEDAYRGVGGAEVDVETLRGTSCDLGFEKGARWLVYALRDEATGRLAAVPCTRTRRLGGDDNEDLAFIRGLRQGRAEQSVLGKLLQGRHRPLAGMRVTASGGGQSFEGMTDGEGGFGFALPKPGAYTVRAVLPFSADAVSQSVPVKSEATDERTKIEYSVEVTAGRCVYNEIDVYGVDLHATAEINGKVLDERGQPVTRGFVHLLRTEPKDYVKRYVNNARIGDDGGFKFERVAVGDFVLVFNPRGEAPGEGDAPYPRTYFPGVKEEGQAAPLVVTEGLKLNDLIFRLRDPLSVRTVSGVVVWPDGKAAAGADVSLRAGGSPVRTVNAAGGRFEVEVYGDFDYELQATVHGERYAQSEKVKVPPAAQPAPVRLVLKPGQN